MLNLFIGIIVDAMQIVQNEERADEWALEEAEFGKLRQEITMLRKEVRQLGAKEE